ncbi:hypothetical protein BaRGS_00018382 [Batillaria attramentaria]|uniref:Uncharacterized protein n=1 Tax=Batillaria attramentaria TaxID=370345 RepID=A0ABD0KT62_9CAEN
MKNKAGIFRPPRMLVNSFETSKETHFIADRNSSIGTSSPGANGLQTASGNLPSVTFPLRPSVQAQSRDPQGTSEGRSDTRDILTRDKVETGPTSERAGTNLQPALSRTTRRKLDYGGLGGYCRFGVISHAAGQDACAIRRLLCADRQTSGVAGEDEK